MKGLPRGNRQWHSKHWAGFSATSKVMCRRGERSHSLCPFCCTDEEEAEHAFVCKDTRAINVWKNEKAQVTTALEKYHTAPDIIRALNLLWPPWDGFNHEFIGNPSSSVRQLINQQQAVRIVNLFRGRLCKDWVDFQEHWIKAQATRWRRSIKKWKSRCVRLLIQSTWNYWQNRNEYFHSHEHPWNQAKLQILHQQLQTTCTHQNDFLPSDWKRVKKWNQKQQTDTVETMQQRLQSISAARLKKQHHATSLQPQRKFMENWLQKI